MVSNSIPFRTNPIPFKREIKKKIYKYYLRCVNILLSMKKKNKERNPLFEYNLKRIS